MKALFLLYEDFAEFEINILGICLRSKYEVVTTSAHDTPYVTSAGGFRFSPHVQLSDVRVEDYEFLIIPGGEPFPLLGDARLHELIGAFRAQGKLIGAICGGPVFLADAGVLAGVPFQADVDREDPKMQELFNWELHQDRDVVNEQGIITARGGAYVEFAMEVSRHLGIFDEESVEANLNFFKNIT